MRAYRAGAILAFMTDQQVSRDSQTVMQFADHFQRQSALVVEEF